MNNKGKGYVVTKILIISDTHQNHFLLGNVLALNADCDFIIHLGDDHDDLNEHEHYIGEKQVHFALGFNYNDKEQIKKNVRFNIEGIEFAISHVKEYLKFDEQNCIYCFGHTHNRYFLQKDNLVIINPGHLKKEFDRNNTAGYVVVELSEKITANFYEYQGTLLSSHDLLLKKSLSS